MRFALASLIDIEKSILHAITCTWHVPGSERFLRFIQSEKVALPLLVLALCVIARRSRPNALRALSSMVIGLGVAALIALVCWRTVDRLRPPHHYDRLLRVESELDACAVHPHAFPVRNVISTRPSFPSQHGLTIGGIVMGLWLASRRLGLLAAAFGLLIAYGRLYLGRHWPSDIVVGVLIGAIPTWLAWRIVPALHGWFGLRHWFEEARAEEV